MVKTSEDTIEFYIKSGEEISNFKKYNVLSVYKKNVTVTYEAGVVPNKRIRKTCPIAGFTKK